MPHQLPYCVLVLVLFKRIEGQKSYLVLCKLLGCAINSTSQDKIFRCAVGVYFTHKYTPDIQEPFLLWHGAQIGGLLVFPVIKITVVLQVRMSPTSTAVGTKR